MKVAFVGSRKYPKLDLVRTYVNMLPDGSVLVSGGAGGVDSAAEDQAKLRGLATEIYRPDWDRYGRAAGLMRNPDIIRAGDRTVAFWDGSSPGTKDDIRLAREMDKPLLVIGPSGEVMMKERWP